MVEARESFQREPRQVKAGLRLSSISPCDCSPKSGRKFFKYGFFSFFFSRRLAWPGQACRSVPSHKKIKSQGLPLGYQLPFQLGARVTSVLS